MYFAANRKLRKIIVYFSFPVLFILVFMSTAHADWDINKRAQIESKQGCYLRFEAINGKYIRFRFALKRKNDGVFSDKLPIYRVDENDIHIIEKEKRLNELQIRVGSYLGWVISNAQTPSKELKEFMNGQEVVFQYYRDDGKIMEAVFLLDGIKEALEEILN